MPMQLVVVMAVTKAVRAATMTFTMISRMFFFLSFMIFRLFLRFEVYWRRFPFGEWSTVFLLYRGG